VPTDGNLMLVASIPQDPNGSQNVDIYQVIDLCVGEGSYSFSLDGILLSSGSQNIAVFACLYQGTGPYYPAPGITIFCSPGVNLGLDVWRTIVLNVPFIAKESGTTWTLFSRILVGDVPNTPSLVVAGLDNWRVEYTSVCVIREVLVPP
jgi:hypothetical protein